MLVKRVSRWVGLRRKGAVMMVGAGQFRLEARATEEFVRGRERDRAKGEGVKETGSASYLSLVLRHICECIRGRVWWR